MLIKPDVNRFAKIKVLGIGGGGSNAVNRMLRADMKGIDLYVINTDSQVRKGDRREREGGGEQRAVCRLTPRRRTGMSERGSGPRGPGAASAGRGMPEAWRTIREAPAGHGGVRVRERERSARARLERKPPRSTLSSLFH
jgi:hypothetical protein